MEGQASGGVEVRGVATRGPTRLNIDFYSEGELPVAIVGPSGAGKTWFLRLLGGLERVDSGSVKLCGEIVDDARDVFVPAHLRGVGFGFAERLWVPTMSLIRNLRLGRSHRVSEEVMRAELSALGLDDPITEFADLSTGQARRVTLLRALSAATSLALLDEPFSSLDAVALGGTVQFLQEKLKTRKYSVLVTAHGLSEVARFAPEAALVVGGELSSPRSWARQCFDAEGPFATQAFWGCPLSPEQSGWLGLRERFYAVPPAAVEVDEAGMNSLCDARVIDRRTIGSSRIRLLLDVSGAQLVAETADFELERNTAGIRLDPQLCLEL